MAKSDPLPRANAYWYTCSSPTISAAADDKTPAMQRPLPIRSTIVSQMNRVSGSATWKEEQDLLEI